MRRRDAFAPISVSLLAGILLFVVTTAHAAPFAPVIPEEQQSAPAVRPEASTNPAGPPRQVARYRVDSGRDAWGASQPHDTPQTGDAASAPSEVAPAQAVLDSDPRAALILLTPLLTSPTGSLEARSEAFALSAEALEELDLPVLSLLHWQRVLQSGNLARQKRAFHEASRLSLAIHNDDPLQLGVSHLDPKTLEDPGDRAHAFYLKGVALDADDQLSDAVATLTLVPPDAQDYVRARLLMATVLTRMRQRAVAIATVQDLMNQARDRLNADEALKELVLLTLARSLYGAGRVEEAIDIYRAFPRRSPAWLEVQTELAWAWYRTYAEREDWTALNHAIGTVHTLTSPFFKDRYLPEPDLLAAQFLYHLCRFMDGERAVEAFIEKYTPMRDQLKEALNSECSTPGATLNTVLAWRAFDRGDGPKPETKIPEAILQLDRDRPSLAELEQHLAVLIEERATLNARIGEGAGETFERLLALLDGHEGAIRDAYDRSLRAELRHTLWDLNQLIRQGRMVQLSMTSAEKDLYEAAAAGNIPVEPPSRKRRKHRWPTATRQVWPFDGEYWADELGYYESRAVPLCPD